MKTWLRSGDSSSPYWRYSDFSLLLHVVAMMEAEYLADTQLGWSPIPAKLMTKVLTSRHGMALKRALQTFLLPPLPAT
jgi:hypothetical protein